MRTQQLETCAETPQRAERRCEERLVYLPSSRDRMYAIPLLLLLLLQAPRHHLFPSSLRPTIAQTGTPFLLLLLLPHSKPPLKVVSPGRAEVVAASDHVGPVRVVRRVERCQQREHFRRVAAAAEDDEEVRWRAAFAGKGTAPVDGGEDVDETQLLGCVWVVSLSGWVNGC